MCHLSFDITFERIQHLSGKCLTWQISPLDCLPPHFSPRWHLGGHWSALSLGLWGDHCWRTVGIWPLSKEEGNIMLAPWPQPFVSDHQFHVFSGFSVLTPRLLSVHSPLQLLLLGHSVSCTSQQTLWRLRRTRSTKCHGHWPRQLPLPKLYDSSRAEQRQVFPGGSQPPPCYTQKNEPLVPDVFRFSKVYSMFLALPTLHSQEHRENKKLSICPLHLTSSPTPHILPVKGMDFCIISAFFTPDLWWAYVSVSYCCVINNYNTIGA